MLSAESQLLERNIRALDQGRHVLLVNPPQDDFGALLSEQDFTVRQFTQDYSTYQYLAHQQGVQTEYAAELGTNSQLSDHSIIFMPKGRSWFQMLLQMTIQHTREDGVIWLVGHNQSGIKSAARDLQQLSNSHKLDSARHCQLYAGTAMETAPFDLQSYRQIWHLPSGYGELTVASYPGVFAHGRLDEGTAMLLAALKSCSVSGAVLDFGCGCGVLGAAIKQANSLASVDLVDVSALAVLSSKETFKFNRLEGEVKSLDDIYRLDKKYNLIVSNPPFHRGQTTLPRLSLQFIRQAAEALNPGAELWLVANAHLPYLATMREVFKETSSVLNNKRYNVYKAVK